jgi:hypothetical protein
MVSLNLIYLVISGFLLITISNQTAQQDASMPFKTLLEFYKKQ